MTSTSMGTNGSEDDPLQAALAEAESLMSDLGSPSAAADEDALATKFSIDDSDGDLTEDLPLAAAKDKAEEGEGPPKDISADFHPLHADFLQANPAERDPAAPALGPGTASGGNSGSSTLTPGAVNGSHPLGTPAFTGSVGNRANLAGASPSPMAPMLAPGTAPSTPAPSLDVFKAQTSRFASKVAGMAQRGLSQVASATSGTGLPNAAAFTAFHHTNAAAETTPMPQHLQQQTPPSPLTQSSAPASAATLQPQAMVPMDLDNEQKAALVHAHVGDLLKGERIIMFLSNLLHVSDSTGFSYSHTSQPNIMWCCAMTYYRLILFGTHPITTASCPPGWNAACWPPSDPKPAVLQMPLASMDRVEKSVFTAGATTAVNPTTLMGLLIHGKDNARQLRFTTPSYADTLRAHELLQTYSFPGRRNLGYLFAFESKREDVMASIQEDESGNKTVTLEPARKRFEPLKEFPRLLSLDDADNTKNNGPRPWAIWSTVNQTYQMCMSYPNILVGPASLDDNNPDAQHIIRQCASFRSEQRLPALTWTSGTDGASIWRCAQPKVGLQGNRSSGDELFLKHIMESAASANAMAKEKAQVNLSRSMLMKFTGTTEIQNWVPEAGCGLKILDLRPRSAAMANRAGGYGYEDERFYMGSKLQFCNIGNIHAVRDAYQKLSALCLNSNASDLQWTSAVEDTKWLSMVRLILAASWEAAFWVHVYRLPVLLHCSHGKFFPLLLSSCSCFQAYWKQSEIFAQKLVSFKRLGSNESSCSIGSTHPRSILPNTRRILCPSGKRLFKFWSSVSHSLCSWRRKRF